MTGTNESQPRFTQRHTNTNSPDYDLDFFVLSTIDI